RQGPSILDDDAIFVTLDPFNTGRAGYFFGTNPHGVRYDGVYRNVSELYSDWDGIWNVRTSRFDGGWTAEYEIPYRTPSRDPNTDTGGVSFARTVKRKNEASACAARQQRRAPERADEPLRRRLARRVRDSVPRALVRPDHGHVGAQFLAHGEAQERGYRVVHPQSALGSERRRPRSRLRRPAAGARARRRRL